MRIAFWSAEDGCGTTSGMAAIASICADIWNRRILLFQSSNQSGDLSRKLGAEAKVQHTDAMQDSWEELRRLAGRQKLTKAMLLGYMVPVVRGHLYYLPQGEYKKREVYPEAVKRGTGQVLCLAEQMSDLIFIDCGSGEDQLSEYLLSQAEVVVVTISQERANLDAYFQGRHAFQGKVIYLVNQYHQESVYNRKNLNRMYRLCEEELAVILHDPLFRYISERGKIERFVRRHMHGIVFDRQFYFMQELIQTAMLVLKAAGYDAAYGSSGMKLEQLTWDCCFCLQGIQSPKRRETYAEKK